MTANGKRREIDMGINPDDESVKIADSMKPDASVVRAVFETEEQRNSRREQERSQQITKIAKLLQAQYPGYFVSLFTNRTKPAGMLKDIEINGIESESKTSAHYYVHVAQDFDAVGDFIANFVRTYSLRIKDVALDNKEQYLKQIIEKMKQLNLCIVLAEENDEVILNDFEQQRSQFETFSSFKNRVLEKYIHHFLGL